MSMARYWYQKINERREQTLRKARKSKSNDDWKSYKNLTNKCNKKDYESKIKPYQKSAQW